MFISFLVKSLSRWFCKTMPCLPAMTGNGWFIPINSWSISSKMVISMATLPIASWLAKARPPYPSRRSPRRPLRWPPRPTKLPSWSHPGEGWRQSTTPGPWDPWENHGKIHVINGILGPKWWFFTGRISKTRKTWSFDWENHLFSKKKRMKSHVFFCKLGPTSKLKS